MWKFPLSGIMLMLKKSFSSLGCLTVKFSIKLVIKPKLLHIYELIYLNFLFCEREKKAVEVKIDLGGSFMSVWRLVSWTQRSYIFLIFYGGDGLKQGLYIALAALELPKYRRLDL